MTDISHSSHHLAQGAGAPKAGLTTAPNATWRLAIAATALALLLGLSAAALHDNHQAGSEPTLGGRGKWAGYM